MYVFSSQATSPMGLWPALLDLFLRWTPRVLKLQMVSYIQGGFFDATAGCDPAITTSLRPASRAQELTLKILIGEDGGSIFIV